MAPSSDGCCPFDAGITADVTRTLAALTAALGDDPPARARRGGSAGYCRRGSLPPRRVPRHGIPGDARAALVTTGVRGRRKGALVLRPCGRSAGLGPPGR